MSNRQITHELSALFREKNLHLTEDALRFFQRVCQHLEKQGIAMTPEILEFALDVIQIKEMIGLGDGATGEDLEHAKGQIMNWLEAMGWRRSWFTASVGSLKM
jgi:hypothetical protein